MTSLNHITQPSVTLLVISIMNLKGRLAALRIGLNRRKIPRQKLTEELEVCEQQLTRVIYDIQAYGYQDLLTTYGEDFEQAFALIWEIRYALMERSPWERLLELIERVIGIISKVLDIVKGVPRLGPGSSS